MMEESKQVPEDHLMILEDSHTLLNEIQNNQKEDPWAWWQQAGQIKNKYRETTCFYLSDTHQEVPLDKLMALYKWMADQLEKGIEKAEEYGQGLLPTYFVYEASKYETLGEKTPYGLEKVNVKEFKARALPAFLEGPARLLKISDPKKAKAIASKVKASGIYDPVLKMYKTSAPLDDEAIEIGRIRAFTPGWLERESVFLHMTYKYLLGLLKAGAYEAYMEAMASNLIPFLPAQRYGRPTTENSSFLASSRNPDSSVHGQGFVARLSGSTAEALQLWLLMFVGNKGVSLEEDQLVFRFEPVLPSYFFDSKGQVSFSLFGHTKVTYENPSRQATYGDNKVTATALVVDGKPQETPYLTGAQVDKLRRNKIQTIKVVFS
jgi:hypothetical protein